MQPRDKSKHLFSYCILPLGTKNLTGAHAGHWDVTCPQQRRKYSLEADSVCRGCWAWGRVTQKVPVIETGRVASVSVPWVGAVSSAHRSDLEHHGGSAEQRVMGSCAQ
jgi:hypothetical protein